MLILKIIAITAYYQLHLNIVQNNNLTMIITMITISKTSFRKDSTTLYTFADSVFMLLETLTKCGGVIYEKNRN